MSSEYNSKKDPVKFISPYIAAKALNEVQENEEYWGMPSIENADDFHFAKELSLIVKKLEERKTETVEENSTKHLILAYAYSLSSGNKKLVKDAFEQVNEDFAKEKFINLYTYLKFTLMDNRKTLIITHFGDDHNFTENYYRMLGYNSFIKKRMLNSFRSYKNLIRTLSYYGQVFFVGHNSELKIKSEPDFLDPKHFELSKKYRTQIIGFFNCGTKFIESEKMGELFDVIFHDNQAAADISEFFLAKYLYEYLRTKDLFTSLDKGKLAMWLKLSVQRSLLDVRINGTDYFSFEM